VDLTGLNEQQGEPARARSPLLHWAACAPVLLTIVAHPAHAQSAGQQGLRLEAPTEAGSKKPDIITVTGSRIHDGRDMAVPVAILASDEIEAQSPANLSDLVNQLPSISPGSTSGNSSGNLSNGLAGINSVNLRGLGATRTLVLVDGRRSIGSAINGVVDINTIPQALVRRVEVVTGGASAQYGSDAIGGVVNFILDTDRRGMSLKADQGVTTQGDGAYRRLEATAGLSLLDGRMQVLLNGDHFEQEGVSSIKRSWNGSGYFQINNPAYTPANGQPERIVGAGVGPATYTSGGLVASGPLRGTYFLGDGRTGQLNYGAYAPAVGGWMTGGDTDVTLAGHLGSNSLIPDEDRTGLFGRTSFAISSAATVFGQLSWNRYRGRSEYQRTPSTGVAIRQDNAFLLSRYPSIAGAMKDLGLASVSIGTSNANLPVPGSDNRRDVYRFLAGAEGHWRVLGQDWNWSGSFQHGATEAREELVNVWNTARMTLAQDAVSLNGQSVCRSSLADPLNGCVPIDRLGGGIPSAAALAYVFGPQRPRRDETISQDVASIGADGQVIQLPGGAAALAVGAEWRREGIRATVDQAYRSGWLYGNYQPAEGHYEVKEAFAELRLPILPDLGVEGAVRVTDYSTSGTVATWKAGATWTPVKGLRLRATHSRDIRAPNLADLFAGATSRTNTVILPSAAPISGSTQVLEQTLSNPDLKPERAHSWTAGALVIPRFLEGLSASFDYFSISIDDAIGSVTAQNTVNLCYSGATIYCPNLVFSDKTLASILVRPVNFASQRERGFDAGISYRTPLAAISSGLPGVFRVNGSVTHYISNVVDNGVFPVDYAGVNGDSTFGSPAVPSWTYRVSAFWEADPVTLNVVARGFGAGVYGNDFKECSSSCPVSTTRYRTINDNHIAGATYLDASLRIRFKSGTHDGAVTVIATNILDKAPVPVGNGPDGNNWPAYAQTNRLLYHVVGRVFRMSASVNF
jgi:outer membrane receptor protein involved in Fe transport